MKRLKLPHYSPEQWHLFRRLTLIGVLGAACVVTLMYSPQLSTWREQWKSRWARTLQQPGVWSLSNLSSNPSLSSAVPIRVTDSLLLSTAQEIREEHNLDLLEENMTLKRLARLLALEAEDAQSISVPSETSEIMRRLTPAPPKNIEVILLFAPKNTLSLDLTAQLASSSALISSGTTQIGVATRSATFDNIPGILGVVTVASTFSSEPPVVQPVQPNQLRRPLFTGQDLWQAVQNYRKAHSLPTFEQSNELCTVASIRVNELLQLGRLDNHDGFQKRADEFFERNKGWTSINENIASGYDTAVQTVEWGWDQSLGHQALIQSREYPKACAAANSGFSVLVTGK